MEVLFIVSAMLFVATIIYLIQKFAKHSAVSKPLVMGLLLASIGLMKFIAYKIVEPDSDFWKAIVCGFLHSLQSFSMDEDYDSFFEAIALFFSGTPIVCGYSYIISVVAPVAGGAILLDILMDLFPKTRFWLFRMFPGKMYIFSELNNESVALGKSIKRKDKWAKLVYTDVYADRSDEPRSELIESAKIIGALCIKDDISVLWPNKDKKIKKVNKTDFEKKKRNIFFIIDKSKDNIQELVTLFDNDRAKNIGNADVYVFSDDIGYSGLFGQACDNIAQKSGNRVDVHRKNISAMLSYDVLEKYPLYIPLKSRPDKHELNLTIVGSDSNALEMFLNSYWCGQMSDIELNINVVSDESEEQFVKRIDKISPEILESGKTLSEILTINPEGTEYAKPYFNFNFVSADMNYESVDKLDKENNQLFMNSDYIFISLGNDNDNINFQREISRKLKIIEKSQKTVIVFLVGNPEVNKTISTQISDNCIIEKHVIGSLDYKFDFERIKGNNNIAKRYTQRYNGLSLNGNEDNAQKNRYNFKSDYTRAIHLSYRAFSAMKLRNVDCSNLSDTEMIIKYLEILEKEKKELRINHDLSPCKSDMGSIHAELRWIEHRRWNANLRTRGYIYRSGEKDISMKTHCCLVECFNTAKTDYRLEDKLSNDMKIFDDPIIFDLKEKEEIIHELNYKGRKNDNN